mmetsp:Transcript_17364/g.17058  ORF Transcript_17364/g.17058 Transcript_17364/m.17058 type:complete len:540 (+) Transcript_17364:199-1818(+)
MFEGSEQLHTQSKYMAQNYTNLSSSHQLFENKVTSHPKINSQKEVIGKFCMQTPIGMTTQNWAGQGPLSINQRTNLDSMKKLHSSRKKIRNILKNSSCIRDQKIFEPEYFTKRFSSPVNNETNKNLEIPFIKKNSRMISRNGSVIVKNSDRCGHKQQYSIFDEIKKPKKVVSREIYIRKQKHLFRKKSRSKTVRGSQGAKSMKYKPVLKTINKCVVKDTAVESWTGYSMRNPLKVNQDSYIISKDLLEDPESIDVTSVIYENEQTHLFCVCDGHGDDGKSVSEYIKSRLPNNIKRFFNKEILSIPEIIEKAVNRTDKLIEKSKVEDYHSGSTLTGILVKGRSFFPFNVGDSRCALVKFKTLNDKVLYDKEKEKKIINSGGNVEENKLLRDESSGIFQDVNSSKITDEAGAFGQSNLQCRFEVQALTKDHNCEVDREVRRIYQNGGRIEKNKATSGVGGVGPLRVWFRHEQKPGLAMTRSIGDHQAREIGVIATPEIGDKQEITELDYGVLVASDGIFEVLNHSTIAQLLWEERGCIQTA